MSTQASWHSECSVFGMRHMWDAFPTPKVPAEMANQYGHWQPWRTAILVCREAGEELGRPGDFYVTWKVP